MPRLGTSYSEKLEHSGVGKSFQHRERPSSGGKVGYERGAVGPMFAFEGAIKPGGERGGWSREGEEEVEEVEENEEATDEEFRVGDD